MVLPGVTVVGPARAVAKSQGFVNDPSPAGEPVGEAKNSAARSNRRSSNSGRARSPPGAVASGDTQAAHSTSDVSAKPHQPGGMRGRTRAPRERMAGGGSQVPHLGWRRSVRYART